MEFVLPQYLYIPTLFYLINNEEKLSSQSMGMEETFSIGCVYQKITCQTLDLKRLHQI